MKRLAALLFGAILGFSVVTAAQIGGGGGISGGGGGGGSTSPGGSDTQIQFNDAGSFGGSAEATLTTNFYGGSLVTLGPAEATLPAPITGLTGAQTLLVTLNEPNGFVPAMGIESVSRIGLYIATVGDGTGYAVGSEYDVFAGADADVMYGQNVTLSANTFDVATAWAYTVANVNLDGGTLGTLYGYHTIALGGTATNTYPLWFDEAGVYRVKADNTFNAVYQAIPALYNPQFTKYTAGATNFERCVPGCQWESNVAVITTEAGGTGTLRDLRIGDASVNVIIGGNAVQATGGYKSADGTAGATVTTCTSFKNGLCVAGT